MVHCDQHRIALQHQAEVWGRAGGGRCDGLAATNLHQKGYKTSFAKRNRNIGTTTGQLQCD